MSVSSYVRVRCSLDEAKDRYGQWIDSDEVQPLRLVPYRNVTDLALSDDEWLGLAVVFYEAGSWTIIEEVSGGLSSKSPESWLELADGGDLVYAGYNDAVPYAELLIIKDGRLVRRILRDEQDSSEDVDIGQLPEESRRRFRDWEDVMKWVAADEDNYVRPEQGWLWIHAPIE